MNSARNLIRAFFAFLILTLLSGPPPFLFARSAEQAGIPKPLQEWIPWVSYNQEAQTCTLRSDNDSLKYCSWPTRLVLDVADKGASFRQEWLIETKSLVLLPGGEKLWPASVKDSGKDIAVVEHEGKPAVWLERGSHVLTGTYTWDQYPESIDVPRDSANAARIHASSPGAAQLLSDLAQLIDSTRQRVARAVNAELVLMYWKIGARSGRKFSAGNAPHTANRLSRHCLDN